MNNRGRPYVVSVASVDALGTIGCRMCISFVVGPTLIVTGIFIGLLSKTEILTLSHKLQNKIVESMPRKTPV